MTMPRRAQSAMEYLMTYGWAILIVVIVLIVLVWGGIFNAGNANEYCRMGDGSMNCHSIKATENEIVIDLFNNKPVDIVVCDLICDDREIGSAGLPPIGTPAQPNCQSSGVKIKSGKSAHIGSLQDSFGPDGCVYDDGLRTVGEEFRGKIYVIYTVAGEGDGGNARVQKGELLTTMQP